MSKDIAAKVKKMVVDHLGVEEIKVSQTIPLQRLVLLVCLKALQLNMQKKI